MEEMATLKAEVKNGHLVLNEPTDLPEGTVVELVEADPFADMDPEERAKLHAVIEQSRADAKAGLGVPAEEVIRELRSL